MKRARFWGRLRSMGSRARARRWVVVAVLVGVATVGLALLFFRTGQPGLCGSCHEMQYAYRTWKASTHRTVSCGRCHSYRPGLIWMVRRHFSGPGDSLAKSGYTSGLPEGRSHRTQVASRQCKGCHNLRELPADFTYHLLTISHGAHLERGTECTDCHANVVHGGKAPFKNTPTMASCLACHDGEQAPNRCGLCHQKLGEVRPPLYNPEWVEHHKQNLSSTGADVCQRCHGKDFCQTCHAIARPHPADWVRQHEKIGPEERKRCATCHQTRGKRPEADFCTECHRARRAHGTDFLAKHPTEFQKEPDACGRCHKETFCADCHDVYMPHGSGWLEEHPEAAQDRRDSCRTCHEDAFCQSCHTKGRPTSHTPEWTGTHPVTAKQSPGSCRVCHPTNFCQRCHQKRPPANHEATTWIRAHGGTALADRDSCRACHDSGYCGSCHRGVTMPHPKGWLRSHPTSGISAAACRTCHAEKFCSACHRGSKPASHGSQWSQTHGREASRSRERCQRCHSRQYCEVCHRIPMPHPEDIRGTHKDMALGKDGRYCGLCHGAEQCSACHAKSRPASHDSKAWPKEHGASEGADGRCALCHGADSCDRCHGLPMPHPEDWLLGLHGTAAAEHPSTCGKCHGASYCQTCHEQVPPKSHEAEDFAKTHGANGTKEPLCALCHGRNEKVRQDSCVVCHRGITMPHPDGYALEHKTEGSYKTDGPCLACHELDHCKLCHAETTETIH